MAAGGQGRGQSAPALEGNMPLPTCLPPAQEGRLTLTPGQPHHQVKASLGPATRPPTRALRAGEGPYPAPLPPGWAERRLLAPARGGGGNLGRFWVLCLWLNSHISAGPGPGQALPLSGLLPQGRAPGLPGPRLCDGPSTSLAVAGRRGPCASVLFSPLPPTLPPDTHTRRGPVPSGAGVAQSSWHGPSRLLRWGVH